jgi:glycerol uptake facilitator-like aquaporin
MPSETLGPFNRVYFIGPLVANIINAILLALLIFSFGAVSGAHFNPLITVGTFFARLTTFPRMVLYLTAQISGATLAGLLLRASANTRDFKAGGCYLFSSQGIPVRSAFTIEVVGDILLLFLAFGVGLDPRQREIFGPALAPIFVGLAVGSIALLTAYSVPGYGGAGLNPARCFGVFVGSRFPGYHWVHWVGAFVASIGHGLVYFVVPPGEAPRSHRSYKIGRTEERQQQDSREKGDGNEPV